MRLGHQKRAPLTEGTGTPVRGGLTFREGHYITEAVAESGCLVAVDIMVSIFPSLLILTSTVFHFFRGLIVPVPCAADHFSLIVTPFLRFPIP